jgi:hypothetical protein
MSNAQKLKRPPFNLISSDLDKMIEHSADNIVKENILTFFIGIE